LFEIKVKKHLLICTCILGLSATGVLVQSTIHSSPTESNLALNEVIETHITAEQQKQAELNSVKAAMFKDSEDLNLENNNSKIHVVAEEQQKIGQTES